MEAFGGGDELVGSDSGEGVLAEGEAFGEDGGAGRVERRRFFEGVLDSL